MSSLRGQRDPVVHTHQVRETAKDLLITPADALPAFRRIADFHMRYLFYDDLNEPRAAIMRFGSGLKGVAAISRRLS